LDFRARQFNVLVVVGVLTSLISISGKVFTSTPLVYTLPDLLVLVTYGAVLWYSTASGRYQVCYMLTIVIVFLFAFPAMFFNGGGYHGVMPSLFAFAVIYTAFMLDGKKKAVMIAVEVAVYASLYAYAFYNPDTIRFYGTDMDVFAMIAHDTLTTTTVLGATVLLQLNLYKQRQAELEAARRQVQEYADTRSELFTRMSHEMRTPLTVMAGYAQLAVKQIRKNGASEQTLDNLTTISNEAKRLAEMADSTLRVLMNAGGAARREEIAPVDVGELAVRLASLMSPLASRKGVTLRASASGGAAAILGDADALTQLFWNLLQNAITHSKGSVELLAAADARGVKITVWDNGAGVDPEILPRMFECGTSGKGGYGIGLAVCRDIAQRHNGDITVESEPGAGTRVTVVLSGAGADERGGENV
jgi:signal transduction histidine kinase